MATRNKKSKTEKEATGPQTVAPETAPVPTEATETTNTAQATEADEAWDAESMAAFDTEIALHRAFPPGQLVELPCDLPGFEWALVKYRTGNRIGVSRLVDRIPKSQRNLLMWQVLPLFIYGLSVREDAEAPPSVATRDVLATLDFREPSTFMMLSGAAPELVQWMSNTGYRAAKAIAVAREAS